MAMPTPSATSQGHAGFSDRSTISSPSPDTCSSLTAACSPRQGSTAMTARRAATGDDVRGLGWRLAPQDWGHWPEATLWHTGFTGTSLLASRPLGLGVVLLTNAIHPVRRIGEQAEMRAVIHRCVSEAFA